MDSRLLNVVYDDPFDGNYVKYDNDSEFWSSGSETMGMQLTETLHGILPIAPTEDFHKDDNTASINLQNKQNAFNYEDYAGQHLASGGAIEIVTVDPNADGYDTDSEDDSDDDDDDDEDDGDGDNDLFEFDRQSHCSNATFRTRTDSSSIGDYESHTSDYDDETGDDDEEGDANFMANNALLLKSQNNNVFNANNSLFDLHSSLVAPDDLILGTSFHKSRTLSTNTINSDVDGFGLQIDAHNFDLAEFITKDDFHLQSTTTNVKYTTPTTTTTTNTTTKTNVLPKPEVLTTAPPPAVLNVIASKHTDDSDSDSDVIVDVETVEVDEDNASYLRKASEILKPSRIETQIQPEEEVAYVDNVKSDPSWCPTTQPAKKLENQKVEEKQPIQKQNFGRNNFSLVPSKKQCDILKGKTAKGKAKLTQKPTKALAAKAIKMEKSPKKEATITIKTENTLRKTGIGMGGKNLALLKHERVSISEQSSEECSTPLKIQNTITKPQQLPTVAIKSEEETPAHIKVEAVKRKLNLEEYKKRRGGDTSSSAIPSTGLQTNAKFVSYKIPKLENKLTNNSNETKLTVSHTTTPTKHSEVVTSVVKTLKEQQNLQRKPLSDPITEAKNKVLRMQELKRAQQMRIIDSKISAKVPRVTKLLSLREIVKDTPYLNKEETKQNSTKSPKTHQDYEEIIIVSSSCNTDISIPPIPNQHIQPVNNASRSLLKSTALLSTISNSFQKVNATDNVKISTQSLIASIQDVIVNKTNLPIEESVESTSATDSSKPEHHGENKIIMHLRKDRIRKRMCTIGVQTELQPEFPPLPLPKASMQHKSRERMRKHRKRQYRKHDDKSSSSSSDSSSSSSDEHTDNTNSRDNSCSSSIEHMRTYDSAIGTGGYSSRSSRKHRSSISSSYSESADRIARGRRQRRTSYTKRSAHKRSRSPYSSSSSYTSDSDRSRSPLYRRSRSRSNSPTRRSSYRQQQSNNNSFLDRNVSQPAVEERRIVYVGRIEQETTKDMLRRKFLQYGTIKQISIHYKDTGMKYGFVTFERSEDAFTAIDTSARDPQINMYDVSFGGRRAFCRASYADLDNAGINTYQSFVFPQPKEQPKEEDSFEALLQKMKAKLNANKTTTASAAGTATTATAANTANATNSNNKI